MSIWSAEAAQRDSERQKLADLHAEKITEDRRIIKAHGDLEWAHLRILLGNKCREFNSEPGKAGTLSAEANLLGCRVWITGQQSSISGTYSAGLIRFYGQRPAFDSHWKFKVTEDGLEAWLVDEQGRSATIEDIANTVIEILLATR